MANSRQQSNSQQDLEKRVEGMSSRLEKTITQEQLADALKNAVTPEQLADALIPKGRKKVIAAIKSWSPLGAAVAVVLVAVVQYGDYREFKGKTDKGITNIESSVGKIQTSLDKVQLTISQILLKQAVDAARENKGQEAVAAIRSAVAIIDMAQGSKTPPDDLRYFNSAASLLNEIKTSDLQEEVHAAFNHLVSYRSSIESPPDISGTRKQVDTSITTAIDTRKNVKLLLGAYVIPVYVHGDVFRSTAPLKLSSNVVIDGPAVFLGMVPDASQTLDGIHWVGGVTFVNMRIRYNGGEMELQNVRFVGCTFEFPQNSRGTQFAEQIAIGAKVLSMS